ncbi:MAG: autotransporter domain-containing protein [Saprospiraceae bacterium]|nr:autotransporter domain-containing protein [Saprospiraceae bacterium]
MKTNRFFAIAALFCFAMFSNKLQAQLRVDATIAPISLLAADVNVGADFQIKENFSLGVTAMYGTGDFFGLLDSRTTIPVNVIGKYYFNPKHGADGFYADGFARYAYRNYKLTYKDGTANEGTKVDFTRQQAGLGFGFGYKVVSAKGFVFDIGTGVGRAVFTEDNVNVDKEDYNDFPKLGKTMGFIRIGVGYRFGSGKE